MQDWAKDPEKDKEAQEREAEEKEQKEEQDDPEELQKKRAFDDWKDGKMIWIFCQFLEKNGIKLSDSKLKADKTQMWFYLSCKVMIFIVMNQDIIILFILCPPYMYMKYKIFFKIIEEAGEIGKIWAEEFAIYAV